MPTKEELGSAISLITHISSYQLYRNKETQKQYCDILIHPDLEGYTVTSFNAADSLIKIGEETARTFWPQLKALAKRQQQAPAPVTRNHFEHPLTIDSLNLSKVLIDEQKVFSDEVILEKFPGPMIGKVAFDDINSGMQNLYATKSFQKIGYSLLQKPKKVHSCTYVRWKKEDMIDNYGLPYILIMLTKAPYW